MNSNTTDFQHAAHHYQKVIGSNPRYISICPVAAALAIDCKPEALESFEFNNPLFYAERETIGPPARSGDKFDARRKA